LLESSRKKEIVKGKNLLSLSESMVRIRSGKVTTSSSTKKRVGAIGAVKRGKEMSKRALMGKAK